jgi:hypothetical protein
MGLDIVEMVIALETEFGVQLPAHELRNMETVGELFDCVVAHAGGPDPNKPTRFRGPTWNRYLDVIEKETGARRADLRPEARFIRDLGLA